ncbi:MAG: insulinase family protein [candidate division KSB1 bacterium]|nr:insulinase family protein [candidate division KSB1 bacterium]
MRLLVFMLLGLLLSSRSVFPQSPDHVQPANLDMQDPLPVNPDVTLGEFENGLKYYVQVNRKPENRATLWLAVNAGSVLEDENQRGLAHFVEHMAFNGTKHFEKQALIDYLESIGMQFGPEINAFTSFDETVYFLNVPTDSSSYMETGFQILEDWAHALSLEPQEIDRERGVVIEEWRLGRGAQERMLDEQLPVLFRDSRYAERLPIGKKNIIESADYGTIRKFYRDWYRPGLIGVVAVGDFDRDYIMELLNRHFASLPARKTPRERTLYPVPDHEEALFAIATDKEASRTRVSIYFKSEPKPVETVSDYRVLLVENLYNHMLNKRLKELTKQTDPPFLYAYSGKGQFVRTKEVYLLGSVVKENSVERGLEALLTEALRVKRHGFTASELERAKREILRSEEQAYKERDKTQSRRLARHYVSHFLSNDPIPGPGQSLALARQLLPDIQLQHVNALAGQWITEDNRVVMVNAPEKQDVAVPDESRLSAVFKKATEKAIGPWQDNVRLEPLIADVPPKTDIMDKSSNAELGVTELELANGVKVVLKPTDFKNDQVLFDGYSFGGHSLTDSQEYVSALAAASIIQESGVGKFSSIELEKKLSDKVVSVSPYINTTLEGIRGSASPQDMKTLFQLIYLYMTAPRKDAEAFESFMSRMKGYIENRSARPETAFMDTLQVTLGQHHPRSRPWTLERLKEIDYTTAFDFYQQRYADAGDFTFFFVGNFDPDSLDPLIQTYLGALPSTDRSESWQDPGIRPPDGIVEKSVYKGVEPKSLVRVVFTGAFEDSRQNRYALNSLASVMRIKLREVMREDMGGTYGVQVRSGAERYPNPEYSLHIMFGCAPQRVEELVRTLFAQIDSLQAQGPAVETVSKVRKSQQREYEVNLKENRFWLSQLKSRQMYNQKFKQITSYPDLYDKLSVEMIQDAAQCYIKQDQYVKVVLYPEKTAARTSGQ